MKPKSHKQQLIDIVQTQNFEAFCVWTYGLCGVWAKMFMRPCYRDTAVLSLADLRSLTYLHVHPILARVLSRLQVNRNPYLFMFRLVRYEIGRYFKVLMTKVCRLHCDPLPEYNLPDRRHLTDIPWRIVAEREERRILARRLIDSADDFRYFWERKKYIRMLTHHRETDSRHAYRYGGKLPLSVQQAGEYLSRKEIAQWRDELINERD